jgi:energy-coupling factor transporter ATP-binding protein EcfA2
MKWYDAYRSIAEALHTFYLENPRGTAKRFYRKVEANQGLLGFPDYWSESESVDPIQLFALLSMSNRKMGTRLESLKNLMGILGLDIDEEEKVDFSGCPFPIALRIYSARNLTQQQEIWNAFAKIIEEGQSALDKTMYDMARTWYGIETSSFTIFLFWIDSMNFLPLDKNTDNLLIETGVYEIFPKSFDDYKKLLPYKNNEKYRKFTKLAYQSAGNDKAKPYESQIRFFFRKDDELTTGAVDFKLLAIKPLERLDKKFLKVLREKKAYTFYRAYDFEDTNKIIYNKAKDLKLFDIGTDLKINVSAIVGKNGSGKSTITELIYVVINNLTKYLLGKQTALKPADETVNCELYFYSNTIYRIRMENGDITIEPYTQTQISNEPEVYEYTPDGPRFYGREFLYRFFYSVAINYSHYALNKIDLGDWIQKMFHKNDAYQAPIVINPMRTDGNIDINVEKKLIWSRLLVNLLSDNKDLRILSDKKTAKELTFEINTAKLKYLYGKTPFPQVAIIKPRMDEFKKHFKLPNKIRKTEIEKLAEKYIFKKLITICTHYQHYKKYKKTLRSEDFVLKDFKALLTALTDDPSHITYKLKQAINFLKFRHFKDLIPEQLAGISEPIALDAISACIRTAKKDHPDLRLSTMELLPPSFYSTRIKMQDKSDFEELSSGEKQRIHTIQSLLYHLVNIDSVADKEELIQYRYINILFDEVELYFHPEMQRCFIFEMLQYLSRINLARIRGLNICFVTHSPFILSDIPEHNIMFLKTNDDDRKADQVQNLDETFGGNIHDMLKDNFYLTHGYMGEFAKDTIKSAIDSLLEKGNQTGKKKTNVDNKPKTFIRKEWDKESLDNFIELIGEPLIRTSLRSLWRDKYVKKDVELINMEIRKLQEQKEKLLDQNNS